MWIPLLIVIAAVVVFTLLGYWLARLQPPFGATAPAAVPAVAEPAPRRERGQTLAEGVNVAGIDREQVSRLREIIAGGDAGQLVAFLAYYRPSVVPLDLYLAILRERYFAAMNRAFDVTTEPERLHALQNLNLGDAPELFPLSALERAELRWLLESDWKESRRITRQLMDQFGGEAAFRANFLAYAARLGEGAMARHVPRDHADRALFERLEKSGMAARGRAIPLTERLTVMTTTELRVLATELGAPTTFVRRRDFAEALAKLPASAVRLAMKYDIDDLYFLVPGPASDSIEREWRALEIYARLLAPLRARLGAP